MSEPIADMGNPDRVPDEPKPTDHRRTLMVVALAVLAGLLLGGSALLFLGGGQPDATASAPVPRGTPSAAPSASATETPKPTKALISNRDPFKPLVESPKPSKTPDPQPSTKDPSTKAATKASTPEPSKASKSTPKPTPASQAPGATPNSVEQPTTPAPATTAGTSDPAATATASPEPVTPAAPEPEVSPTSASPATTPDPALSSAPAAGNTLVVKDIANDRSSATVTINGTKYRVKPGESFAGFYQMYEVFNDNCAGFLYGDSNAVACVGEPIPL